jgi:aldehyde:ferredoxin oxidoreductase
MAGIQALELEDLAELFSVGMGGNPVSSEDLLAAAEKNRNVERAFEVREGLTRKDDMLPKREFNKNIGGWFKEVYIDRNEFEKAKDEYYALRGWDIQTAAPTGGTLAALGLDDIAEDLKKRKIIAQ